MIDFISLTFNSHPSVLHCLEYQMNDSPHLHANVYMATMYQYLSLVEVAQLMQDNLVRLQDIVKWHEWVCCEDYHNLEAHEASLLAFEKLWTNHNKDDAANSLCSSPGYLWNTAPKSLWQDSAACTEVDSLIGISDMRGNSRMHTCKMQILCFHGFITIGTQ